MLASRLHHCALTPGKSFNTSPSKLPLPRGNWAHHLIHSSVSPTSPYPKWHLNWFSHYCKDHYCDQQKNRHRPCYSVYSNRLHVHAMPAMQPKNIRKLYWSNANWISSAQNMTVYMFPSRMTDYTRGLDYPSAPTIHMTAKQQTFPYYISILLQLKHTQWSFHCFTLIDRSHHSSFWHSEIKSVFSFLRQLTTWHCSHLLLSASHAAINWQQSTSHSYLC